MDSMPGWLTDRVQFLTFGHSGRSGLALVCAEVKTKNGRLASLASNPLVTVYIFELWAKWVN